MTDMFSATAWLYDAAMQVMGYFGPVLIFVVGLSLFAWIVHWMISFVKGSAGSSGGRGGVVRAGVGLGPSMGQTGGKGLFNSVWNGRGVLSRINAIPVAQSYRVANGWQRSLGFYQGRHTAGFDDSPTGKVEPSSAFYKGRHTRGSS